MANNNTKTTSELEELKKALKEGAGLQTLRAKIEQALREDHGQIIAQLSNEELDELITNTTEYLNLRPIVEHTARAVADKTLFAVNEPRWYADKAVDILATALGVGAAVWAGQKTGLISSSQAGSSKDALPGASEGTNPFADTTPVTVSPLIGRSRPTSVHFDHQAS